MAGEHFGSNGHDNGSNEFRRLMEPVATQLLGEPDETRLNGTEWRYGSRGSLSVRIDEGTFYDHEAEKGGGILDLIQREHDGMDKTGALEWLRARKLIEAPSTKLRIVATYAYVDAAGHVLFEVVRYDPKDFRQRRPDGKGGWIWNTQGVQLVPFRLPELVAAVGKRTIYIAEGEKGVLALVSLGLVATCSPGGAGKWRPQYNGIFAGADVVVLSDNDPQAVHKKTGKPRWHPDGRPVLPGQDHAADVAKNLHGIAAKVRVVMLPGLPEKGDVFDWIGSGGTKAALEALTADILARDAKGPTPELPSRGTTYGRLLVLGTKDIDTAMPRSYLLKGLLSPAEISVWVGAPKCGKSFLMLHIAYRLSLGLSVFGRRVKPTKALYVAAEGEGGINNRIDALRNKYGESPDFHWIAQPADLLHDGGHKLELIDAAIGCSAQLIVLDTLSRLMAGGDENSPQDMGSFVANVAHIRHDTKAHIAIVHHGTKASNGTSPRGHSSLTGADDALIEVVKQEDGSRVATVVHAKDDADGMRWGFALDCVELGTDDDGDPITTLVVEEKAEAPSKPDTLGSPTVNEKIGLRTLDQAMKADGIMATVFDDHTEGQVVREADWRAWFYREGKPGADQKAKQKAFKRAVDGLLAKGLIGSRDDLIWPKSI